MSITSILSLKLTGISLDSYMIIILLLLAVGLYFTLKKGRITETGLVYEENEEEEREKYLTCPDSRLTKMTHYKRPRQQTSIKVKREEA